LFPATGIIAEVTGKLTASLNKQTNELKSSNTSERTLPPLQNKASYENN
jgi:hypothetical protein